MASETVKLKFLHICDEVILSVNGKISLINLFQFINSKEFPAIHSKFTVITHIKGYVSKYSETIEIISPSGEIVANVSGDAEIKNEEGGNNFIADFINIQLPLEGKYWIKVSIDGNILSNKDEHFFLAKKT